MATSRRLGGLALDTSIETTKTLPLDARDLVRTKEERLDPESFLYGYKGMLTTSRDEERVYMLIDKDNPSQESSWKLVGPYDDSELLARVAALEQGGTGQAGQQDEQVFMAEYNVTTAQELLDYLASEPVKPIVVKRDGEYRVAIFAKQKNANSAIVRVLGTINGEYYVFDHTVTGNNWSVALHGLQKKLVSGTDIKTVGGESLLGSGNIPLPAAYNDAALAARVTTLENAPPGTPTLQEIVNAEDGASVITHVEPGNGDTIVTRTTTFDGKEIRLKQSTNTQGDEIGITIGGREIKINMLVDEEYGGDMAFVRLSPYMLSMGTIDGGGFHMTVGSNDAYVTLDPALRRAFRKALAIVESDYEVCVNDAGGNVVQIGTIKEGDDQRNIYQFYYRTDSLANNAVKTHSFANLLADYSISGFIDATGITSNGVFVGNGRTDNDNRLIVQQFSKNNKNMQIRTYQDFSAETALLKVVFMGSKTA